MAGRTRTLFQVLVFVCVDVVSCVRNVCQNADGQLWSGVFESSCGINKMQASSDIDGPYCTVSAQIRSDANNMTITNVMYESCSAIKLTSCTNHQNPPSHKCDTSFKAANISQLLSCEPSESGKTCVSGTPPFTAVDGTNCTSGFVVFPSDPSYLFPNTKVSATIDNTSLKITRIFSSPGGYSCHSSWHFFAPPPNPTEDDVVIQSRETGKCLDLRGGDTTNGNKLWLWNCLGNANQKWKFENGRLRYASSETLKCVDFYGGNTTNGVQLQIWDCAGTPQQQWEFDRHSGTIYLASRFGQESLKCIDLRNGGAGGDMSVQLWDCQYGAWNQQWVIHDGVSQQTLIV